jgi:hypothetical protein
LYPVASCGGAAVVLRYVSACTAAGKEKIEKKDHTFLMFQSRKIVLALGNYRTEKKRT